MSYYDDWVDPNGTFRGGKAMASRGHRKRKNRPRKRGRGKKTRTEIGRQFGTCMVCGQPLGIEGGMANTDMCGPCCTGEADTLSEFGETW